MPNTSDQRLEQGVVFIVRGGGEQIKNFRGGQGNGPACFPGVRLDGQERDCAVAFVNLIAMAISSSQV